MEGTGLVLRGVVIVTPDWWAVASRVALSAEVLRRAEEVSTHAELGLALVRAGGVVYLTADPDSVRAVSAYQDSWPGLSEPEKTASAPALERGVPRGTGG